MFGTRVLTFSVDGPVSIRIGLFSAAVSVIFIVTNGAIFWLQDQITARRL